MKPSDAIFVKGSFFGDAFSKVNACYTNVASLVADRGGAAVYGWLAGDAIFTDLPVIQAWIHHCIWRDADGNMHDVTPQIIGSHAEGLVAVLKKRHLFIPDAEATLIDEGGGYFRSLLQRYTALVDDARVHAAIDAFTRADIALEGGDLAKERYWAERAFRLISAWGKPDRLMPVRRSDSFRFDDN